MAFTQSGACPRCGAPIWIPTVWHSINPPPSTFSCLCFPVQNYTVVSANTALHKHPEPQQELSSQDHHEKILNVIQKKVNKGMVERVQELMDRQDKIEKMMAKLLDVLGEREPEGKSDEEKAEAIEASRKIILKD